MSSENLSTEGNDLFTWNAPGIPSNHLVATYEFSTPMDGTTAALGIAKEQSVCATNIPEIEDFPDISDNCAKLLSVESISHAPAEVADQYYLTTDVYGGDSPLGELRSYRARIAFPESLFGPSLTRLWNGIYGEVHRLGFLSAVKLVALSVSDDYASCFPGPAYGVSGLRAKCGVQDRPLFCRSMRPASGLDTDMMLRINNAVLSGGFDVIKDDELTYHTARSPFVDRVRRMTDMKRRIEDATGEKKLYFANIIEDLDVALRLADEAAENGADGVLLSPSAQGLSFISTVRARTDLAILSHNTCMDALTRPVTWGVSDQVLALIQRMAGADLMVTPGPFSTRYQRPEDAAAFLEACRQPLGHCASSLPIIQGGKKPDELAAYTTDVGSADYMIIAATWLDNHPDGIKAAAAAFRQGWDAYQAKES